MAGEEPVTPISCSQVISDTGYFVQNGPRVADALLSITDARAKNAKSGVVRSTYDKLRGSAKKNVEQALPRLGKLVEKHAPVAS